MKLLLNALILLTLLLTQVSASLAQDDATALKGAAIETYADIVYANYADSYDLAVELQTAITDFIATPSEETLETAKTAWLAAREPYGQTEAFRFYGGPIDDEDGPEGLINAWPLDEVYIDYVDGMPEAGIINDLENYPEITPDLLESLNEQGAEENISVGFHAVEFLLWGQDLSADGAGQRAYTDYTDAPNADRRAQYLTLTMDLLISHLEELVMAWSPDVTDNYRAEFLALEPDVALGHIFTGIGVLSKSELAGERIFTAYDNQDQEDEHSCFSDNTHRDIFNNALGIANVYRGSYIRVDGTEVSGTGLKDVVEAVDPDANAAILAQLDSTLEAANTMYTPFDQAIILAESRPQIVELVFGLQDQGDLIAEAAIALGITIDTALPE